MCTHPTHARSHRFIWRIILPFLDPRTRQKVQMITE